MAGNKGAGHGVSVGSWIACIVIIASFVIGGVAMIIWNWPLFWVGVGVLVVGCVIGRAVNIMEDVMEYGAGASDPETTATG